MNKERYYYQSKVGAEKIRNLEYVPMINDSEVGRRTYRTSNEAFVVAKDRAEATWRRANENAPTTAWECAGKPRTVAGRWDWVQVALWHKSAG